jgi:hypothetical protein
MRPWLPIVLLALSAPAASADSLLTVRTHVDGFEILGKKQPSQDGEVRFWVGASAVRRDDGSSSAILRLDRGKLYLIDHDDKTYSALDLPVDLQRLATEAERPLLAQLTAATKVQVAVSGTAENRQIGRFAARRFDVAVTGPGGKIFDSTLWVSRDVPGYEPANRAAASLAALQPGSTDWARELERLPGFPVLQETVLEMTGAKVRSREELVSVETQNAPAGSYEPPAGYKERRYDPLSGN